MKYLLLVTFFLNFISLQSQNENQPIRSLFTETGLVMFKNKESNEKISGNIHLNKHWFSTLVLNTLEGKAYKIPRANFNVKENKFVIKLSKDSIFAVDISRTKSVIFDNKKFEIIDNQFYQRISKGGLNIFKKYDIKIVEGVKDAISKIKMTDDRYVIEEKYYLKRGLELEKIKISKKRLFKLFKEEQKKKVKKYVKENSLKFKKEKDLIKILSYYNSI